MFDFTDLEVYKIVNILGLIIGGIFGAVAQKTQFCFSGSIKDYFLTKSTRRAASIVMAMMSAIIFTQFFSFLYDVDLQDSLYYKEDINYLSIIVGGIVFGMGMMIADGCASRSLVKFAQGDVKALVTLVFVAIFALAMKKGFLYNFYELFVANETLINFSAYLENFQVNVYAALILLSIILISLTRKIKRIVELYDGVLLGFLIALAWYSTSIMAEQSIQRVVKLSGLSFVYPSAQTLELFTMYEITDISFSISSVLGLLLGAFIMSRFNKRYSFGCTSNIKKSSLKNNILGGSLMGIGGVLALGCTVGEGLSGISTLAFVSFVAISSIMISAFFTAKYLNKKDQLPMCFIFEWKA